MENNQEQFYKKGEDAATGIVFADAVTGFADAQRPGCVLHILCLHGGMSFMLHDVRYNVAPQDYVILPNAALASDFTGASDVEAIVMSLSETLVASLALRSTYGTALYKETGDIYLVADVLGHKDVNTTKKHYAAIDEDRRRQAASAVKLRES